MALCIWLPGCLSSGLLKGRLKAAGDHSRANHEVRSDVRRVAAASMVLLLLACGGSFSIVEHHDPIDNCWKVTMDNNVLPGTPYSQQYGERVEFNVQRSIGTLGDPSYQFIVEYLGTAWMNFRSGMSLYITADGNQYQLSTMGFPLREDMSSGNIREQVVYSVTRDELLAICSAGGVRVRVIGTSSYVERDLSDKNLSRLRDFCNSYVLSLPVIGS